MSLHLRGVSQKLSGLILILALLVSAVGLQWFNRTSQASLQGGEYTVEYVIDGDTLKLYGLPHSVRLIGVDTEETFKDPFARSRARHNFPQYVRRQFRRAPQWQKFPKFGTPMGEAAARYVRQRLKKGSRVRLEYDRPGGRHRDYYGRYLAYVFYQHNQQEILLNLELVKLGFSPYYTKYGYLRRYHRAFEQAQREARRRHLGIWSPRGKHYPDYGQRLQWWRRRVQQRHG